jgi:dihydrofolate reductase
MPEISLIAALGQNRVIGVDNRLPWRLPDDLRYFKALTLGHVIIMGRKTYESIGRPLPGRRTIVISRSGFSGPEGVKTAVSIEAALALCAQETEVFFVGGASLYAQVLPLADRLYLTEVDAAPDGDAIFPAFDLAIWRECRRERHRDASSGMRFDFVSYTRQRTGQV